MEPAIAVYKENDLVWAKMKGFSPWPGKVTRAPPEMRKAPKKSVASECIFFFGTKNYAWIEHQNIKPYAAFKDDLVRTSKTGAFRDACSEIEEYIKDPEKYEAAQPKGPTVISVEEQFNRLRDGDANGSNSDHSEPEPSSSKTPPKKETPTPKPKSILVKRKAQDTTPTLSNKQRKSDSPSTSARRKRNSSSVSLVNDSVNVVASTSRGNPLLNRPVVRQPETPELDMTENLMKITKRNITPSTKTFGFLGLGIMGSAIVRNMLHSGHKVIVWNRTAEKCRKFVDAGALYAKTPCDVVSDADITFACVADPQASKDIVFGNCGVLQAENGVGGYVELSTIDPETSQDICEAITGKGGKYLEVQLQGSKPQAETGDLIILGAGHRELFSECQSCFQSIARNSFFMGDVGNACKVNLIIQCMIGVNLAGLAEGMSLADRCGVNLQDVLDIIQLTTFSSQLVVQKAKEMFGNTFIPNQPLAHMQKDLRLALGMAELLEHSMPTTAVTNEVYKHAKRLGYGKHDTSAVYNCLNEIDDKIPPHGDDSTQIKTKKLFTHTQNSTSSASCRLAHLSKYFSEDFRPAVAPVHVYMNTSDLKKETPTTAESNEAAIPERVPTPHVEEAVEKEEDEQTGKNTASVSASQSMSTSAGFSTETISTSTDSSSQLMPPPDGTKLQTISHSPGTSSQTMSPSSGISFQSIPDAAETSSELPSASAGTSSQAMSALAGSSLQAMLTVAGSISQVLSASADPNSLLLSALRGTASRSPSADTRSQSMSTSAGPSSQVVSVSAGTSSQAISALAGSSSQAMLSIAGTSSQTMSTSVDRSSQTRLDIAGTSSQELSASAGPNSQLLAALRGTRTQSLPADPSWQSMSTLAGPSSQAVSVSAGTSSQAMSVLAGSSLRAMWNIANTISKVMSASPGPSPQAMFDLGASTSQGSSTSADPNSQLLAALRGTSSQALSADTRSQSMSTPAGPSSQAVSVSARTRSQAMSTPAGPSSQAVSVRTRSQAMSASAGSTSQAKLSGSSSQAKLSGTSSQTKLSGTSSQTMSTSVDPSSQATLDIAGTSSQELSASVDPNPQLQSALRSTSSQVLSADTRSQSMSTPAGPSSQAVSVSARTRSQARSATAGSSSTSVDPSSQATSNIAGTSSQQLSALVNPNSQLLAALRGTSSQSMSTPAGPSSQAVSGSAGTSSQAMSASAGSSSQAMLSIAGTSSQTMSTSIDPSSQATLDTAGTSSQELSASVDPNSQLLFPFAGTSWQSVSTPAGPSSQAVSVSAGPSSQAILASAGPSSQAILDLAGSSSQESSTSGCSSSQVPSPIVAPTSKSLPNYPNSNAMSPIVRTSSRSLPVLPSQSISISRSSSRQRSHTFPICNTICFPIMLFTGKPAKHEPFVDNRKIKMPWNDSSSDESNPYIPPPHFVPNVPPEFNSAQSPVPSTSFAHTHFASPAPSPTPANLSLTESHPNLTAAVASFAESISVPLATDSSNASISPAQTDATCTEIERSQGAEEMQTSDPVEIISPPISVSREVEPTSFAQSDLASTSAQETRAEDSSHSDVPPTETTRVLTPSSIADETLPPESAELSFSSISQIAAPVPAFARESTESANLNPALDTSRSISYTTNSYPQPVSSGISFVESFRAFTGENEPQQSTNDDVESDSCSSEMLTHTARSPKRARFPSTPAQAERSRMNSPAKFNFRPISSPTSLLPRISTSFFQLGRALSSPQLSVNISSDSNSISIPSFPIQPPAFNNENIDVLTPPNNSLDFVPQLIPTASFARCLPSTSLSKRAWPSVSSRIDNDNSISSAESISPPMPTTSGRDFPSTSFAKRARTLSPPHFLTEDSMNTSSAESIFFNSMSRLPIFTAHPALSLTELVRKLSPPHTTSRPLSESNSDSISNPSDTGNHVNPFIETTRILRVLPNTFLVRPLIITLSERSLSAAAGNSSQSATFEPFNQIGSQLPARAFVRVTQLSASEASSMSPASTASIPSTSFFGRALLSTPPQVLAEEANLSASTDSNAIPASASDTMAERSESSSTPSQCFLEESSSHYSFASAESVPPQDKESELVVDDDEDEDSL